MNFKTLRLLKNLSTAMVVVSIAIAFLIAGIRIFGIQVFGVLTGSMEPSYPTGSLIYVKDVNAADLRVNDVITFSISPNVIATHRIVEIVPDENNPSIVRYRTKGDANNDVDASLVSANNIIGKALFAIPKMGYLASYIQQPPGIYVAILVCGLMIAFVFYTDSLENKLKQQNAAHQPQQTEAKGADVAKLVNQISQKLLGRPLIQTSKNVQTAPAFRQGYAPQQPVQQQPVQQPAQYGYPQQPVQQPMQPYAYAQQPVQQPYYGMQNQYSPYAAQGYAQPVNPVQPYDPQPASQPYGIACQQPVQQTVQQFVPQQGYAQQQAYQPSYPQQTPYPPRPQLGFTQQAAPAYQQPYAAQPDQPYGYRQQSAIPQQPRSRRTDRL